MPSVAETRKRSPCHDDQEAIHSGRHSLKMPGAWTPESPRGGELRGVFLYLQWQEMNLCVLSVRLWCLLLQHTLA